MAKLKVSKLPAATLLEVIVAMVIVMVVFGIAMAIYTNVTRSAPSLRQQQGRALAGDLMRRSIEGRNWEDQQELTDSISLQQNIMDYQDDPGLLVITVVATENGRELGRMRQIVEKGEARDE